MVTVKEPFVIDVPNKSSFYETRETADKRVDGIWRTSGIVPIMRLLDHVEIVEVEDLPF